jgi:hypothetical protein
MRRNRNVRVAVPVVVALAAMFAATGAQARQSAAPVNTVAPTISGTPTVEQTLSASDGTWSNAPTSFAYQWLRCNRDGNSCASVANGSLKTYTLVGADARHTMRVRVTASNSDGSSSAQSTQTATVAAVTRAAPDNTVAPSVSGTPKVGEMLTADPGSWTGSPAFGYQWQRCDADVAACSNVIGATGTTYVVPTADLGYRLRVLVTARNPKGTATAPSAITSLVIPAVRIVNRRPTLVILNVRFVGSTVYARFRICDDSLKNVGIRATDSRPGKLSYTRRFSTLVAPRPCGAYTRHWLPAARFRGAGRYTMTLRATDKSGLSSPPARRTFSHG